MSLFYNHLVFGICIVNRLGSLYDYYISTYELLLKSQLQNKYQLKVLFKIISGTLTFQGGCSSLLVSTEFFIIFLIRYLPLCNFIHKMHRIFIDKYVFRIFSTLKLLSETYALIYLSQKELGHRALIN